MGLFDFTTAKFLGASTEDAMMYSFLKDFFSADTPSQNPQQNYQNNYYCNNQEKESVQENKNTEPVETVPLEEEELEELKKPPIFDDSKLDLLFMKEDAKKDFNNHIGIYNNLCIVRINATQKKYLLKYVQALLECKTEKEIRKIQTLYINNTGLSYLKYFSNFSFKNGLYPVQIYLERILKMKINLTKSSLKESNNNTEDIIICHESDECIYIKPAKTTVKSNSEIIKEIELSFPFFASEFQLLSSGWVWHKADKELAEIWKEKYPAKMEKYNSDFKFHAETINKNWKVILSNFDILYNNLKDKVQSLSDNQKRILNDYLEKAENSKDLDELFKLQHEVYYGDGFLWLPKIIPYNDTSEPELEIRKFAFRKYKHILENKDSQYFFYLK